MYCTYIICIYTYKFSRDFSHREFRCLGITSNTKEAAWTHMEPQCKL